MEELESVACPLCGDPRQRAAYRRPPWCVVNCAACGVHYLSPRPSERSLRTLYAMDSYYEGGDGGGYASYAAQEASLRATHQRLVRVLERRGLTGGDLLEVGCGHGSFLAAARGRFRVRVGTDFSARAATIAGDFADRIHRGGLAEVPAGERFDTIVALQVIEHVHRPCDFVRDLVARLRPGGRLLLATPNMASFWRRLMGARWPSFKLPEHVVFFDRESLGRLMRSAGLLDLQTIPHPHAFPLSLVAAKLRLPIPPGLGRWTLWIPATTVALCGRRPEPGPT